MDDWSEEYINDYFREQHSGKLACTVIEKKGRILEARRRFKRGEVIFEETPLHTVAEQVGDDSYKLLCRLCKTNPCDFSHEPLWYWAALSSLTVDQIEPGPKKGSLPTVSKDQQRKLLCLFHEPVRAASHAATILVQELRLSADPVMVEDLLQAWILNCFDHSEEPQGYAAYFGASFMSHSCYPNAIWHFAPGLNSQEDTFVLRAREDIAEGDEICISYLNEEWLMKSAELRIKELHGSKQFTCTCQRCGPGSLQPDQCRGFRCPHCGIPAAAGQGVFHKGPQGEQLMDSKCSSCNAEVGSAEAKILLQAEHFLSKKLKMLEDNCEKKKIRNLLKVADVQEILQVFGDSEAGMVGPQHWMCAMLLKALAGWYEQSGQYEDARRMMRLHVEALRQSYPGLCGQLAFALEEQADMLIRHLGGAASFRRAPGLEKPELAQHCAQQTARLLEESMAILVCMFGDDHEYFLSASGKHEKVLKFLRNSKWPAASRKRKSPQ